MTRNTRGADGGEIEVVAAPAHTVVQDLGRIGAAHLGVSRSGVADWLSARVLNRLIGNDDGSALIEMSVGAASSLRSGVVDAVVGVDGAPVRLCARVGLIGWCLCGGL